MLIPKEDRTQSKKIKDRAEIGILVGYKGEHIYRVQVPSRRTIVQSLNVRFDKEGLVTDPLYKEPEVKISTMPQTQGGKDNSNNAVDLPSTASDLLNDRPKERIDTFIPTVNNGFDDLQNELTLDSQHSNDTIIVKCKDKSYNNSKDDQDIHDVPDLTPQTEAVETSPKKRIRKEWTKVPIKQKRTTRGLSKQHSITVPEIPCDYLVTDQSTIHSRVKAYQEAYLEDKFTSDDPQTYKEALSRPNSKLWKKAITIKYKALLQKKTWSLLKRSKVPKGHRVLQGKLVFKTKTGINSEIIKHKVQQVVQGFEQQYSTDYKQTYTGVCKSATQKIAIAQAALFDLEIAQMDAVTAFLNSDIDRDVYINMPPLWKEKGKLIENDTVCKLEKALYGLKQSPRLWQDKLSKALKSLGFEKLRANNCVYRNSDTNFIIVTYIDDFLIIRPKGKTLERLKADLQTQFNMEDIGKASYFVGVQITCDQENKTIYLCQDAFVQKILDKYKMVNCHSIETPMDAGTKIWLVPNTGQATAVKISLYQSIVGSLNYLSTHTRPDISFTISALSRYLANPSQAHIKAAQQVLAYLSGTIYLAICLGKGIDSVDQLTLHSYTDADYAGTDITTWKSTNGWVFFFCEGVISSSSKRQATVAMSSTKSEIFGLCAIVKEAAWLQKIFKDIGYQGDDARCIQVYADNQGALALAENPELHQRTKHMATKFCYLKDQEKRGKLDLWYCSTKEMVADGLTKPLSGSNHIRFVQQLNLQTIILKE